MTCVFEEAAARKSRSIARLDAAGIPWIDHLPPIEPEAKVLRRSAEEIGLRTICLALVSMKAAGADTDFV